MSFYLSTLGHLALVRGGGEGKEPVVRDTKPLVLVAVLATLPDRAADRDYLASLLWPGPDPSRSRQSLRQAIHSINRAADADILRAEGDEVALDATLLDVDLWQLEGAISGGYHRRVLALYGGPFLAGHHDRAGAELEHLVEAENNRLEPMLTVAFREAIRDALTRGDPDTAVRAARGNVERNPLREEAQTLLVRTLLLTGDATGALAAYEGYRSLVESELGDEPGQEIALLARRIRAEAASDPLAGIPGGRAGSGTGRGWAARARSWAVPVAFGALSTAVLGLGVMALLAGDDDPGYRLRARHGTTLLAVRLDEAQGRVRELGEVSPAVASPDSAQLADIITTEDGVDVRVTRRSDGATRIVSGGPEDEHPAAWSPDGRLLAYTVGAPIRDATEYGRVLRIVDPWTGRRASRADVDMEDPPGGRALWSPRGDRLVVRRGDSAGLVVDVAGLVPVTVDRQLPSEPALAWSPDGSRLVLASEGDGVPDLYIVDPGVGGRRRLTNSQVRERTPVWLSEDQIAYLEGSDSTGVHVLDLETLLARRIPLDRPVDQLLPLPPWQHDAWIDSVRIDRPGSVLSPGQRLRFTATVHRRDGQPFPAGAVPLRWSSTDTTVVAVMEDGSAVVRGPGEAGVIASAGGWRADTLTVASGRMAERDVPVLMAEDWTDGIEPRWVPFGAPLPYSRPEGGPEGGVFVSNGDENWPSGAVSRRAFPVGNGLTLESWGRAPFSGGIYQGLMLSLTASLPPTEGHDQWSPANPIKFEVNGYRRYVHLWVYRDDTELIDLPFPDGPEEWHRYALQIEPDGRLAYVFDGSLVWRSRDPEIDPAAELHVAVSGSALDAEILHGPVTVYGGVRYVPDAGSGPGS